MPITFEKTRNTNLVLIIKPFGQIISQDIDDYIHNFNIHIIKPIRCIYDLREIESAPISLIYQLAKFIKSVPQEKKDNIICSVIIIQSTLVKNLLNLLFTFVEPTTPYFIVDKLEDINQYMNPINLQKHIIVK